MQIDDSGNNTGGESLCWNLVGFTPNSNEVTFIVNVFDPARGTYQEEPRGAVYGSVPVFISVDINTGERRTIVEEANYGNWSNSGDYFVYTKININDSQKALLEVESLPLLLLPLLLL